MAAAGPGAAVLRPEGDEQQRRQRAQPLDREVEQLLRARVDPVHVLQERQNRPMRCEPGQLGQQNFEGGGLTPLRAQVGRRWTWRSDRSFIEISRDGEETFGAEEPAVGYLGQPACAKRLR